MSAYYFLDNFVYFHKNMIFRLLLSLFCVFFLAKADGETEIKRGTFPFMAYIYYPDETILDAFGNRFLRGGVLIKTDWLITSGIQLSGVNGTPVGFPLKTLLARLGAITIDPEFTVNEDEDEQEREVIQIVRPYNHSATLWWRTDVTLMKTLLPFNLTSAVSPTTLTFRHDIPEKTCNILIYAKKDGNWTDDRILTQLAVKMLPPSIENCGSSFFAPTMMCAGDSNHKKFLDNNPEFCVGNSGGPLICENEVVGLQTYIGNNCEQPHLYQLISAWENLIFCSTEDNCGEKHCANVCVVTNKDSIKETDVVTSPETTINMLNLSSKLIKEETIDLKETDITVGSSFMPMVPTKTRATEQIYSTISTTIQIVTESSSKSTIKTIEESETKLWPKEKKSDLRKKFDEEESDKIERKLNTEAQHQNVSKKVRSAAERNAYFYQSFFHIIMVFCFI
ncbi:uncharacterized protein LOC113523544 [Galleria mellonella]|uniref:Uncharacterized protein LOC113523544 n=1 Tax=Galleria mellonella TaxID=7137 RepID=A0A6J1X5T0_GALME|nr:uncharacterized protein LOC113523544 [Galleria mellonella]